MLLKRIELVGFKSFFERTVIELREGITAVIGPNGCGKSNIIDAVRWVFGEQSPSSLRIAQQSELLFNGSKAHAAVNFAEVSLIFDNKDNILEMDIAEVAVSRRLHRNGEGGYYLNGRAVQLKDIRSMFYNMGIGFSPYSILEQGKTDRMLIAKTEARREVFEEAAGIRGYRTRFAESNRKLVKVVQQMDTIKPMLKEIERNYHKRKEQWQALRVYREISAQRNELMMQRATGECQQLRSELATRAQRRDELQQRYRGVVESDEKQQHDSQQLRQRLEDLRSTQEKNREGIYAQQLAIERGKDSFEGHKGRIAQIERTIAEQNQLMGSSFERIESLSAQEQQLKQQIAESEDATTTIQKERQQQQSERQRLTQERGNCIKAIAESQKTIAAHEREQQRLRKQMSALSQLIVQQLDALLSDRNELSVGTILDDPQLTELDQKTSHLIVRIVNAIDDYHTLNTETKPAMAHLVDQIKGAVTTLQQTHQQYSAARSTQLKAIKPLLSMLTDPESDFVTRHRLDREFTGLQKQINARKEEDIHTAAQQAKIEQRVSTLTTHLTESTVQYERQKMHTRSMKDKHGQVARQIEEQKRERNRAHDRISGYRDQQEGIRREMDATQKRLQQWQKQLQTHKKQEQELHTQIQKAQKSIGSFDEKSKKTIQRLQLLRAQISTAADAYSKTEARLEVAIKQFRERFGAAPAAAPAVVASVVAPAVASGAAPAVASAAAAAVASVASGAVASGAAPAVVAPGAAASVAAAPPSPPLAPALLAEKIGKLTARINLLGSVNMMAEDEFAEAQSRHRTMTEHYQDLVDAQRDLAEVNERINRQSGQKLKETVQTISAYFTEICTQFFAVNSSSVRLTNPDAPLESNIVITIQPQGKKNERIEHLSGGERAMASLALLFALYRHNPSHVVFLDETDAALDEDNVTRVLHYIRDRLQFTQSIIVTHNRQTISIAQTIVGITMEQYGVSKAVEISVDDYI